MTVLYRLDADAPAITRAFEAWGGDDPWAGGYLAPGQFAPVITAGREFIAGARPGRGQKRMVPRLWGVPPPPAATDPARLITAVRNPDSPFWIGNLRNSEFRCVVPVTSFMEWGGGIDVEGRRLQHHVASAGQPLFAFAGVWKDTDIPGFALLTCPANAALRALGIARMPVVLPAERAVVDTWLYAGWDKAKALLAPCPPDHLRQLS